MQYSDRTSWLVRFSPPESCGPRLVCFHHAGGNAALFRDWNKVLGDGIDVIAVQLPGRRECSSEPPVTSLRQAASLIAGQMNCFSDRRLVLFGHSLGALLAYEVALALRSISSAEPAHLIVCAARAPHLCPADREPISSLPDLEFISRLHAFAGTDPEVLSDAELMLLLCPMLKADFRMAETYRPQMQAPLQCAVLAVGATDDPYVASEDVAAWRLTTTGHFSRMTLPGGHFLGSSSTALLLDRIRRLVEEPETSRDRLIRAASVPTAQGDRS